MAQYSSKSTRGFWDEKYCSLSQMPADIVSISDEQYQQLKEQLTAGKVLDWNHEPPIALDAPSPSGADLARLKRASINEFAQRAVGLITDQYPQFEIDTFADQEREARAWQADSEAPTPTLSIIALGRGLQMADLVARVINKAQLFRPYVASVVGRRQALEDQLDAIDLGAADAAAQIAAIDETQLLNMGWQ